VTGALAAIPYVDVRRGGPARHACEARERVRSLRDECVASLPPGGTLALPMLDAATRRWLRRSRSPYPAEIGMIAETFDFAGVWFLNGCYQWGCTALAREEEGVPWLARTLDWPFAGLGRHLEIARMSGRAGTFDSVTWPGYVGVLTASAPGRFAAAINQAPVWRRTQQRYLRLFDFALNAFRTWHVRFMPPDHLLRQAFESCGSYEEARLCLETTPVARPVIYTLVGCTPGAHCVIERTEESFTTRTQDTAAANDWLVAQPGWEARMAAEDLFTCSYEETAQNSRARREQLSAFSGLLSSGGFAWVAPPVLNHYTRVAVEMCPASGELRAIGYELPPAAALPQPVSAYRRQDAPPLAPN
jgi:hypothetical protein